MAQINIKWSYHTLIPVAIKSRKRCETSAVADVFPYLLFSLQTNLLFPLLIWQ